MIHVIVTFMDRLRPALCCMNQKSVSLLEIFFLFFNYFKSFYDCYVHMCKLIRIQMQTDCFSQLMKVFHHFQGVVQLAIALSEEPEDHIQAAAAWALGQIGRHTPEHAKAVAVANVLPKLLQCYLRADASEDLQTKVWFCKD